MKVLMISGDARMFETGSEAHERFVLQQKQVDELCAVVWGPRHAFGFVVALAQALTRRFDVVTAQDPLWRGLLGWLAAQVGGATLQVQVHGDLSAMGQTSLAQFVLSRANNVRVVSQKIKEQVEALGTVARIDVLPVFIDLDKVRSARAADLKKEFPQFGKIVLFVGRLEEEKNPKGAIQIFADIAKEFRGAGMLVLGDGSERAMLEALAGDLGLAGRVIFLGYRHDAPSLYKAADLMLVTSPYESFGAAIVEALAAGCAVVAPEVGVAAEAGAIVVARQNLAMAAVGALKTGMRGQLKLDLLPKDEWARQWRETLT